jgi:GDP-L-fucose synthase
MNNYEDSEPINLASGEEVSLKVLAEMIKLVTGYTGEIVWDSTKPTGTPAKGLDITKISQLGWSPRCSLQQGIESTVDWFINQK